MKKFALNLLLAAALTANNSVAFAGVNEDAVRGAIINYLPGTTGFAKPKIKSIDINDKKRTVTVSCGESVAYIPLTVDKLSQLKKDIAAVLPKEYAGYKIEILSEGHTLDSMALFANRRIVKPKEKTRFVTPIDGVKAPKGLEGDNIAMWQSHGLYYQGHDEWGWQRPRLWQTCEDLFTQSFVMPFLMPMLENAGAYVMSPRERDTNINEYIVDNDNGNARYAETNGDKSWATGSGQGFAYDGGDLHDYDNPFKSGTYRQVTAIKSGEESKASWNADIKADDEYAVYVSYQSLPNSATDAVYTVNAANGPHKFKINQRMGGGTWIYLGHFPLKAGVSSLPIVELSNKSADKKAVITADAVKIGGGMGNVARRPTKANDDGIEYEYMTSGYPRFTEAARYWLQWAGAPDSVYSATGYSNEYNDDYRSRGYWVNWLAGGSSVLPKEKGLNIPIALSFAFHSDAGITPNDSIIGTLGIYCTDDKVAYPNGTDRYAARDLTDLILTNIVNDVKATYEPQWTRRGMWNRSYAEARVPAVPAVLLELLSHQNFADMRYGLDPGFRFVVSRAIYKAMLQYLAHRDGRDYVVQPLPVRAFAIADMGDGNYRLSWQEQLDSLEPTATPTYYIVEHRSQDGLGFAPIATVGAGESWTVHIDDNDIHSYRIVAGNDGGVSFPSEVLALRHKPGDKQVMIVNGFTRVSGPEWFDYGDVAGFYNTSDPGVAYIKDISFVGEQFEYRRNIPWMSNEVCGLGGSRSDYEDKVIAGNTFDFVALHGASIAKAGFGFVSSSVDAFVENHDLAAMPKIVDLILGNQKEVQVGSGRYGTRFKAFTAPLQSCLEAYTKQGGSVFVSGSYIGTDIWNNPYSSEQVSDADRRFAKSVLGFTWRSGSASESNVVEGVKSRYGYFDKMDITFNNQLSYDCYAVHSPGAIAPSGEGVGAVILKYESGNQPAGTAYVADTHRAVAIGFPFETIETESSRHELMKAVLSFLTNK